MAHDVSIRESLARLPNGRISIYALDGAAGWRRYLEAPVGNDPQLAARWGAASVAILDLDDPKTIPIGRADAVICTNTLDAVPTEDLPWVLDEIFAHAESLVHLGIRLTVRISRFASVTAMGPPSKISSISS